MVAGISWSNALASETGATASGEHPSRAGYGAIRPPGKVGSSRRRRLDTKRSATYTYNVVGPANEELTRPLNGTRMPGRNICRGKWF
jgi:hypothetical protein